MTQKRAILRARADRDVQEAIDFYLGEGSQQAALKFVDALEQALRHTSVIPQPAPAAMLMSWTSRVYAAGL